MWDAVFSADSACLVTASSDQTARLWDVAQGETTRDGESTIAALSAQSEARIRQLNNKVEFLKASLAAEQQRYAELEENLNTARRRLDAAGQFA